LYLYKCHYADLHNVFDLLKKRGKGGVGGIRGERGVKKDK